VAGDEFRAAMSRWASGVSVFTAGGPDGPVGVTVSSFSSVSLDPPLILGCIARSTSAHDTLVGAGGFAVHVLGGDQMDLSQRFAGPADLRFDGLDWESGPFSAPLLPLGLVRMVCARESVTEAGDHTILLGRVVRVEVDDGDPLVYFHRAYRGVVDLT
ncbi:MAG: flavin reductase family protein, partial [Actinomycetota bacterium]